METAKLEGSMFKNCVVGVSKCVRLVMHKAKQGLVFRKKKLSVKELYLLSTLLCKACCR